MSIDPIFWLLAAVGFLALEGMTFSMVSVWFAAGSAAALLCCLFTHSFRVQAVVFIAVSAVCLLAFKPLAKRLHKQPTPTNGDRALGREARVLTPVSAQQTGRVRLDGVDWMSPSFMFLGRNRFPATFILYWLEKETFFTLTKSLL